MIALFRIAVAGVGLTLTVGSLRGQERTPSLTALLEKAAAYLADYQRQMPAVVSEEAYDQVARNEFDRVTERRLTRSDMLVIANDATGWVVFRDVFELNGKPLRDREERLEKLFLKPSADNWAQAQSIAQESARFNVNFPGRSLSRTLNNPMAALRFLSAQNLHRSRFRMDGTPTIDGVKAVALRFEEQTTPRVLISPDNAAANGRFWLDPVSGRVLRSELRMPTAAFGAPLRSIIRVRFVLDPKVGLPVPAAMDESYQLGNSALTQSIEAHATYAKFRKFSVDVSTNLKPPGV